MSVGLSLAIYLVQHGANTILCCAELFVGFDIQTWLQCSKFSGHTKMLQVMTCNDDERFAAKEKHTQVCPSKQSVTFRFQLMSRIKYTRGCCKTALPVQRSRMLGATLREWINRPR